MKIIIKGQTVLFDDESEHFLKDLSFRIIAGPLGHKYVCYKNGKSWLSVTRLIMNAPKHLMVDHINHDTLDNRKENLRLCTNQQNQYNRLKQKVLSFSKYKGVTYFGRGRKKPWVAYIGKGGSQKFLGYWSTQEEAAEAYNKEAKNRYGEFVLLNEISK